ncbi:MAG: methylmalonyl Co-A mutase-associated GTPase MeaB [Alistipes sp.]|nr:methylmalonyl Co-A mutase-associated GTPase MeaB [Alistipes sp.]
MAFTKIEHFEREYADTHHDTALNVTEGVEDKPIVNPYFVKRKKRSLSTDEYVDGILRGDITTLSQAITLVESSNPAHYTQAQEIIERCLPHAGRSLRIGITGVPGAGKSTFIEAVGNMVTRLRHRLAVLAIDPSSERSGGSILGDKTRMESLVSNRDVFIRPSPSAGSLGGVARKTRETIVLCEAAGFDVIFIETVGVGQSETAVHSMVDMFMLLQISGAGDELQGIKRGIMEMADMMVITKADGENIHKAQLAKTQFEGALRLFPMPESQWRPKVYTCSAYTGDGLEEVWKGIEEFLDHTQTNGYFTDNRNRQNKYWMYESINETLRNSFYHNPEIEALIGDYEQRVLNAKMSSFIAAKELLDKYFEIRNSKSEIQD